MSLLRRTALLPVLLALSLSACLSYPEQWVETDVQASNEQLVWETSLVCLRRAGYPVGSGANPKDREIETGWMKSLGPFKSKGYRQRAHLVYYSGGGGQYNVQVRVERESNESFRPLDPAYAKWKADEDNESHARIIVQYIRSTLGAGVIEVGEEEESPFTYE
jgi:hypothetical protein